MKRLWLGMLFQATSACGGGQIGVDPRDLVAPAQEASDDVSPAALATEEEVSNSWPEAGVDDTEDAGALGLRPCTAENPCMLSESAVGFCARENIASVVGAAADSIRLCYERELQIYPELEGTITSVWTIELDGAVSFVSSTSDVPGLQGVIPCLDEVIAQLQFALPQGGRCTINYPFRFRASADALPERDEAVAEN